MKLTVCAGTQYLHPRRARALASERERARARAGDRARAHARPRPHDGGLQVRVELLPEVVDRLAFPEVEVREKHGAEDRVPEDLRARASSCGVRATTRWRSRGGAALAPDRWRPWRLQSARRCPAAWSRGTRRRSGPTGRATPRRRSPSWPCGSSPTRCRARRCARACQGGAATRERARRRARLLLDAELREHIARREPGQRGHRLGNDRVRREHAVVCRPSARLACAPSEAAVKPARDARARREREGNTHHRCLSLRGMQICDVCTLLHTLVPAYPGVSHRTRAP